MKIYPSVIEKSAVLIESLIINHPFIDGNNRAGAVALGALLENEGLTVDAEEENFYNFTISISTGKNHLMNSCLAKRGYSKTIKMDRR